MIDCLCLTVPVLQPPMVCVDAALAGYSLEQRRTFAHSNKVSRRVHTCPLYTCPLPHVCRRST